MKISIPACLIVFFLSFSFFGQNADLVPTRKIFYPRPSCLQSSTVDKLMKNGNGDFSRKVIAQNQLRALIAKDRLAYIIFYPASYRQSCSLAPYDSLEYKKLHRHFKPVMEGFISSSEQNEAIKTVRDSAVLVLNLCLGKDLKTVSADVAKLITLLKAYECIPNLKKCLDYKQDTYIYTLLMLLMINDEYLPFQQTALYKQLYEKSASEYKTLPLTKTYAQVILENADRYYIQKTGKK